MDCWVFPTGTFINSNGENTAKKNIYDVAGNVWEWTTEVPKYDGSNDFVIRGGSVESGGTFATTRQGDPRTIWNVGFRIVLYVE